MVVEFEFEGSFLGAWNICVESFGGSGCLETASGSTFSKNAMSSAWLKKWYCAFGLVY